MGPDDTTVVCGGLTWHTNLPGHPLGGWTTSCELSERVWLICWVVGDATFALQVKPKSVSVYGYVCGKYKRGEGERMEHFLKRMAGVFEVVRDGLTGRLDAWPRESERVRRRDDASGKGRADRI